jgi:hypothetical protein
MNITIQAADFGVEGTIIARLEEIDLIIKENPRPTDKQKQEKFKVYVEGSIAHQKHIYKWQPWKRKSKKSIEWEAYEYIINNNQITSLFWHDEQVLLKLQRYLKELLWAITTIPGPIQFNLSLEDYQLFLALISTPVVLEYGTLSRNLYPAIYSV